MDYEKMYKDALERAKEIKEIMYSNLSTESCKAVSEYIDAIFPELAESEDERIRKAIIELLKEVGRDDTGISENAKCMIAYLEKQKEQKPKDITLSREDCLHQLFENGTITMADYLYLTTNRRKQKPAEKQDYSSLNDLERAIHRGFLSAGVENVSVTIIKETAKECLAQMKPAEWSDTKELVFKDICKHLKEEGYDGWVVLLEALHSGEFKQPVAEWSEEDEKMLIWLCRIIHSRVVNKELSLAEESELGKWMDKWINHEPQHEKKWSEFDEDCLRRAIWYVENPAPSVVKDINLVLWLQSIPERFNLQPKEEWSEVELEFRGEKVKVKRPFFRDDKGRGYSTTEQDEEVAWNALRAWCEKKGISLYDLYPKEEWSDEDEKMYKMLSSMIHGTFVVETQETQDKLLSWLKSHSSRPKSSDNWKPSEEQKEALEYVIRDYREDCCNATANYLQEILDHLKNM